MTTEFISSLKSSGGDYTSMATWEAETTINLTASTTKVFSHSGMTGTVASGNSVTGSSSSTTATVAAVTSTQILVTTISGSGFTSGERMEVDGSNYVTLSNTGDDAIAVLECYASAGGLDESVTIAGGTVNGTNFRVVRVASGSEHDGVAGNRSGFYMQHTTGATNFSLMFLNEQYTRIIGVEYYTSGFNSRKAFGAVNHGTDASRGFIDRVLVSKLSGTSSGVDAAGGVALAIYNSVLIGGLGLGAGGASGRVSKVYNCTFIENGVGNTYAVQTDSSDIPDVRNCATYGSWATADWDTGISYDASSTANATQNSSDDAPGGSSVTSVTSSDYTNVTSSNDVTPTNGGKLDGAGSDLSAVLPNDSWHDARKDLLGNARSSWDIGAVIAAAGAAAGHTPSNVMRRRMASLLAR